jgi:DNA-binding cell septation regulator SpoVG
MGKTSRFTFRGEYDMRLLDSSGSMLAFFNFQDTELGLEFKDFKLFEGKNGVFVKSPSRSYEDAEGEEKYSEYVRAMYDSDEKAFDEVGTAYFEEVAEAAYAEYERRLEEEDEKPRKAARKGASKATGRSSRGASRDGGASKRAGRKATRTPVSAGRSRSGRGPLPPRVEDDDDEDDGIPV